MFLRISCLGVVCLVIVCLVGKRGVNSENLVSGRHARDGYAPVTDLSNFLFLVKKLSIHDKFSLKIFFMKFLSLNTTY